MNPSRRKPAKPALYRKRTISLTAETSIRLSIEAERRGIDRSATAELLLAGALRHIVVQIRGTTEVSSRAGAGEGSSEDIVKFFGDIPA
jgi:hypothetical protein